MQAPQQHTAVIIHGEWAYVYDNSNAAATEQHSHSITHGSELVASSNQLFNTAR